MNTGKKLPGGNYPAIDVIACIFFGQIIVAESQRFTARDAEEAELKRGGGGSSENAVQLRHFSDSSLQRLLSITLPIEFTAAIPNAKRKRDGSFELILFRPTLTRLLAKLRLEGGDPFNTRLLNFTVAGQVDEIYHHLVSNFQGGNYRQTKRHKVLMANIATINGAIELLAVRWAEDKGILERVQEIWQKTCQGDTRDISSIAERYNVSPGLVLATVIQLAARSTGQGVVRALLSTPMSCGPLERALWAPLWPNYSPEHPVFSIVMGKFPEPMRRGSPGRPPSESTVVAAPVTKPAGLQPEPDAPVSRPTTLQNNASTEASGQAPVQSTLETVEDEVTAFLRKNSAKSLMNQRTSEAAARSRRVIS